VPDFTCSIVSEALRFVRMANHHTLSSNEPGPAPMQRRKSHHGKSMHNLMAPPTHGAAGSASHTPFANLSE